MIILLQFISIIFSLIMIYFAYLHYQKKSLTKNEIYFWAAIWILVILASLFPNYFRQFSSEVLVTRLFDLMVVGGFVLVIGMTAKVFLSTRHLEKKVEEFIRSDALKTPTPSHKTKRKSPKR